MKECYEGWDEMLAFLVNWFSGWKEYTGEPVRFMDSADWVVVEIEEVGVAENGMRIEQRFAHAFRLENGKGVEWRMFGPVEETLEALGLSANDAPDPERGQPDGHPKGRILPGTRHMSVREGILAVLIRNRVYFPTVPEAVMNTRRVIARDFAPMR